MPELQVDFTVPVEVLVDTDTGEVTRVVVMDESVSEPGDVRTRDYEPVTDLALARRAREIANGADWPVWEHGW